MFPSPWRYGPSALRFQRLGCSQFPDVSSLVLVHSFLDPIASVLWAACWEVPTAGFLTFFILWALCWEAPPACVTPSPLVM